MGLTVKASASSPAEPSRRPLERSASAARQSSATIVSIWPQAAPTYSTNGLSSMNVQALRDAGGDAPRCSKHRADKVGEADRRDDHGELDGEVVDEQLVEERVRAAVDEPERERPGRRIPHRRDRPEQDVMEHLGQVAGDVRVVARADQVAGGHEDARVGGVPEQRAEGELQGDAQEEDAPVRRDEPRPGAGPRAGGGLEHGRAAQGRFT